MSPGPRSTSLFACLGLALFVAASCGTPVDSELEAAKDAGREACDRYLNCALEVSPESVGVQLASYGPDGACWDSEDIQAVEICTTACKKSRDGLGEIFPDAGACGQCDNDAHCLDCNDGARCDVKRHQCVACVEDGDCEAGRCNTKTHTCAECLEDGDCGDGACDQATLTCVGCLEDCKEGVCDIEKRMCVGCLIGDDCPNGFCDYEAQVCVECFTNINCTGGKTCVDKRCV